MNFFEIDYDRPEKDVINDIKFALGHNEDPTIEDNWAIGEIAQYGLFKAFKLLEPKVDIHFDNEYCLQLASLEGHIDIVKHILKDKKTNITDLSIKALSMAIDRKQDKVVDVLLSDDRVKTFLKNNPNRFKDSKNNKEIYDIVKKLQLGKFANLLR